MIGTFVTPFLEESVYGPNADPMMVGLVCGFCSPIPALVPKRFREKHAEQAKGLDKEIVGFGLCARHQGERRTAAKERARGGEDSAADIGASRSDRPLVCIMRMRIQGAPVIADCSGGESTSIVIIRRLRTAFVSGGLRTLR